MSHAARPTFVALTHSLAALALMFASGCGHAPETISATEEAEPAPAAKPPAAEIAAPKEACGPGGKEDCHCDPDKHVEALSDAREQVTIGKSPARGPADAPVTIVMFSDFECPFCAGVQTTLHTLDEEYPGKLRFVFKHMPLKFHPHAEEAARAALAAEAQGKFWGLAEALFQGQKKLDSQGIDAIASAAGLDTTRLRRDMHAPATDAQLAADKAEVERLHIQGAPSFFVNGRRVQGAQPIEVFRKAIDQALAGE